MKFMRYLLTTVMILLPLVLCARGVSAAPAETGQEAVQVPVLIYHKISTDPADEPNHTSTPLSHFEEQMNYLVKNGYTTIDIADLRAFMEGRISLPPKVVVITFDDGWHNSLNALPILEKHHLKATFFFVLQYLESTNPVLLNWSQISKIEANQDFEIGCHSYTHPYLEGDNLVSWIEGKTPKRSKKDVQNEIAVPKKIMEEKLLRPVLCYSWPSGWYNAKLLAIARDAGYVATVTDEPGMNRRGMDPMKIKRYTVWGQFGIDQFEKLLTTDLDSAGIRRLLGTATMPRKTTGDYPVRQ
jgi:peptidoglycan/xylan/chitin deacetylase (PgdA/CDA1 family)